MKNLFAKARLLLLLPFLSIVAFYMSCGGNGKQAKPNPDIPFAFSPAGLWVNKAYIDTLLLTRSPRTSQQVGGPTCLYFPDTPGQPVQVGLGFHEGTQWDIIRDSGKIKLCDSGGLRTQGVVEPISAEEIKLGDQHFLKLKHPSRGTYDYDIVEELLFSGNYRTDNGTTINLTPDGRASGWDTIRYYVPFSDYIGPGMDVDEIDLGKEKGKLTTYAFKFDKDTLSIYKLKCLEGYDSTDNSCGVVDFGELKWKLVKNK